MYAQGEDVDLIYVNMIADYDDVRDQHPDVGAQYHTPSSHAAVPKTVESIFSQLHSMGIPPDVLWAAFKMLASQRLGHDAEALLDELLGQCWQDLCSKAAGSDSRHSRRY